MKKIGLSVILALAACLALASVCSASIYGGIDKGTETKNTGGGFTISFSDSQEIYYVYEWDRDWFTLAETSGTYSYYDPNQEKTVSVNYGGAIYTEWGVGKLTEREIERATEWGADMTWVGVENTVMRETSAWSSSTTTLEYAQQAERAAWWTYLQTHASGDAGSHADTGKWEIYFTNNQDKIPSGGSLSAMAGYDPNRTSASAADSSSDAGTTYFFYDPNQDKLVYMDDKEAAEAAEALAWWQYLQNNDPADPNAHPDSAAWQARFDDPDQLTLAQNQLISRLIEEANRNRLADSDLRDNPYKDYLGTQAKGMVDARIAGDLNVLGAKIGSFGFTVNLGSGQISGGSMKGSSGVDNFDVVGGSGLAGASDFNINGFTRAGGTIHDMGGTYMKGTSPDNFNTVKGEFAVGPPTPLVDGTFSGAQVQPGP